MKNTPNPVMEQDGLLARVARDIRTPLNDILGYVELMEARVHGALPDSYARYVSAMVSAGETLRDTLDVVGDLALLRAAARGDDHPLPLIELSPDLSAVIVDGHIDYLNAAGLKLLGLPSQDMARGRPFQDFLHGDWKALAEDHFSCLSEERDRVPLKLVDASGHKRDVELAAVPMPSRPGLSTLDPEGCGTWILLVARDIGGLIAAATAVESREAQITAIMNCVQDGILTIDEGGRIETCNTAAATMFGYSSHELIGRDVTVVMGDADGRDHQAHLDRYRAVGEPRIIGKGRELQGRHRDGSLIPVFLTVQEAVIGGRRLFTGTLRNLSREKELAARVDHAERHDTLTGMPNRREFVEQLDAALACQGSGHMLVIVADVSGLTAINEAHGYEAGNQLVLDVATRVRTEVQGKGPCARVAGGSFALALTVASEEDAAASLAAVQNGLSQTILSTLHGTQRVTTRAGGALHPQHGTTARDLLRRAEIALRQVRDAGSDRDHVLYEKSMTFLLSERLGLERAMRVGLEEGQFYLDYQPQFDLHTGAVVGVEALIRWKHPDIGLISPGRFIPVAEASDLIIEIGSYALEEACRQAAAWTAQGIDPPRMGVNLSARQFADPNLTARVIQALANSGLPAAKLELELTEGLLMQSADHTLRVLKRFADMGISIAVDDFGTGYSSLAYLKRFPVSTLKIDRAFVTEVHADEEDRAIAAAIISLASSLGLSTIAEGIELPEQATALRALGCREVQGFLYARPMPAEAVTAYLVKNSVALLAGECRT